MTERTGESYEPIPTVADCNRDISNCLLEAGPQGLSEEELKVQASVGGHDIANAHRFGLWGQWPNGNRIVHASFLAEAA